MTLRAEKVQPVDWSKAAVEALEQEYKSETQRRIGRARWRMQIFVYGEDSWPWSERKKNRWLARSWESYRTQIHWKLWE